MGKKAAATGATYTSVMADIKKGVFAPLYLLMGEEPYYLDKVVEALEQKVVPPDGKDFNQYIYYGADTDISTVATTAQKYPFMSDRQLVVLKEAQSMRNAKNEIDKLEPYVRHASASTVLCVVYKGGDLNATSKVMKAAAECGGVILKSPLLKDNRLDGPIKTYCTTHHVGIDDKAMVMLKEFLGNSLTKIFGEIDKLIVAEKGQMREITPEIVERYIGVSKDYNAYELTNALTARDYAKTFRIINYFERNPAKNSAIPMAAGIFNYFQKMLMIHATGAQTEADMAAIAEINRYAVPAMRNALRMFNYRQTVEVIHMVRRFDCNIKGNGSMQNEMGLLKDLAFKILTLQ